MARQKERYTAKHVAADEWIVMDTLMKMCLCVGCNKWDAERIAKALTFLAETEALNMLKPLVDEVERNKSRVRRIPGQMDYSDKGLPIVDRYEIVK